MFSLKNIVRKNILNLEAYSNARDEYTGEASVFLDANENPFGTLNRYPDPQQKELKNSLSKLKNIPTDNIFIGNGSDEIIDLAFRIFCTPGKDKALTFSPTYGMYDVSANINNIELVKLPLTEDFQINIDKTKSYLNDECLKLIFICSPNNPTGNTINTGDIEYILNNFNGIVILDEAYIDFSLETSWNTKLAEYPNLIVSQTFSKAWGLAAARVGIAYTNENIISLFNKVKPPYNVSDLNQKAALNALENTTEFEKNKRIILIEKDRVSKELKTLAQVKKVYPSDANFLLVEVDNAIGIYNNLVIQRIIIRNRNSVIKNCIRITIGSPEENTKLINALKNS
ncbi:MAG: histidinol-phosphate transaminase [Flavobacteriaceae bacterium]|nr:histidinol-phosphate transaminase [Flavobacteriaceae bacterium]